VLTDPSWVLAHDAAMRAFELLEWMLTAPGRLLVWFRWAMPGTPLYHDDEAKDHRGLHLIFSIGFYVSVFGFWMAERETHVIRDGLAEAKAVFDQQWAERQNGVRPGLDPR
jgi:predicted branched-subunit amino acid permease